MSSYLPALTLAVFAAWSLGCILLLLLSLVPSWRGKVMGLWPLMASELLIICIGLLPWHLPTPAILLLLVVAGARIGFEAGSVYGLRDNRNYAVPCAAFLGLLSVAIWFLPVVPWWGWLAATAVAGALLYNVSSAQGLGRFLLYPALPYAAFVLLARQGFTGVLVLSFLFVELFDSFSLLGGKLAGKHLMAPRISPRKTWEGFGVGLVMLLASAALIGWLLHGTPKLLLALAVVVAVSALAGDLIASAIKRRSGVKDYPTIIPVQGGLLDIVDAWIVAAPVATAAFLLIDGV